MVILWLLTENSLKGTAILKNCKTWNKVHKHKLLLCIRSQNQVTLGEWTTTFFRPW